MDTEQCERGCVQPAPSMAEGPRGVDHMDRIGYIGAINHAACKRRLQHCTAPQHVVEDWLASRGLHGLTPAAAYCVVDCLPCRGVSVCRALVPFRMWRWAPWPAASQAEVPVVFLIAQPIPHQLREVWVSVKPRPCDDVINRARGDMPAPRRSSGWPRPSAEAGSAARPR
jgi:hypothetical protein